MVNQNLYSWNRTRNSSVVLNAQNLIVRREIGMLILSLSCIQEVNLIFLEVSCRNTCKGTFSDIFATSEFGTSSTLLSNCIADSKLIQTFEYLDISFRERLKLSCSIVLLFWGRYFLNDMMKKITVCKTCFRFRAKIFSKDHIALCS